VEMPKYGILEDRPQERIYRTPLTGYNGGAL